MISCSSTSYAKAVSILVVLVAVCAVSAAAQSFTGVFTMRNDNARTGQNLFETVLTPQTVNAKTFGKVFSYSVDGQIFAQPLYVPKVTIPGKGIHNVVYVATENDSLYAFDADGLSAAPLWQVSFVNPAAGVTPVLCPPKTSPNYYCSIFPVIGISSTPVIDPATNTMYVLTRLLKSNNYVQSLHAVDITTGAEKFGGPVNITGSVPGTGTGSVNGVLAFSATTSIQRAGLLLNNGRVYIAWAGTTHGWLMSYDATTLQQKSIMSTSPNWIGAGAWGAGNAIAADAAGNIFAAFGDGGFDLDTGGIDFGDTLAKFDPNMNLLDYFTPMDQQCRAENDRDLGSGGPMLMPSQPGSVTNEILIAGKGGNPCDTNPANSPIYVVNRDAMGGYNATADSAVQNVPGAPGGYWSSPAYWQSANASYVYYGGVTAGRGSGDYMKMFSVTNGLLSSTPTSQTSNLFPVGATPSISANSTTNGVVWAVERQDALGTVPGTMPAVLFAYDATNLGRMLYNSANVFTNGGLRDSLGCGNKFAVPTVANGRVYVGTQHELDVFGILKTKSGPDLYLATPCFKFDTSKIGTPVSQAFTVANVGNQTLTISAVSISGLNAADFSQTNNCTSVAAGANCTITVTFKASSVGAEAAHVMIADNANASGSPHNILVIGGGER